MTLPQITTMYLAKRWWGIYCDEDSTKKFVTFPFLKESDAKVSARFLAEQLELPYNEQPIPFRKPIVAICPIKDVKGQPGYWIAAKIFKTHIEYVADKTNFREQAENDAKNQAEAENLEYFAIGENLNLD